MKTYRTRSEPENCVKCGHSEGWHSRIAKSNGSTCHEPDCMCDYPLGLADIPYISRKQFEKDGFVFIGNSDKP